MSDFRIVTVEARQVAMVHMDVPFEDIAAAHRTAHVKIAAALETLKMAPSGPWLTMSRAPANGRIKLSPGVVVPHAFEPVDDVAPFTMPAGRAASYVLKGPYTGLREAWIKLGAWFEAEGLKSGHCSWEVYGPFDEDPARLETTLYSLLAD